MTAHELMSWAAYERVAGPVLAHERIDVAGAMIAAMVGRSAGADLQPRDLLPRWDRDGGGGDMFDAFERLAELGPAAGGD